MIFPYFSCTCTHGRKCVPERHAPAFNTRSFYPFAPQYYYHQKRMTYLAYMVSDTS